MAPPGRRRPSTLTFVISLLFLFSTAASAASTVLGIDLGTEYLKAVLVKPGIPLEIVLTKDSKRKETAALAFKPLTTTTKVSDPDAFPERVYGGDAIALAARFPGDVFSNLKPLLGRLAKDSQVEEFRARHPGQRVIQDKLRGTVAFRSGSFGKEVDPFSVEELLAMELRNLRTNAEALAGKGSVVQDAVITIPGFYTVEERRAVEFAADLAGLRVLALISDGLAVGLNYATSRTFPSVSEGGSAEYHLLYDMGAGSARATVLRFQGRTVKDVGKFNKTIQEVNIMGAGWDRQLGGDALNGIIVEDMVSQFVETKKMKALGTEAKHVKEHGKTMAKLWKEAQRIRQVLSANTETAAYFESLFYEDANFRYKLSRTAFEELASSYAERVREPVTQALSAAKLTIADLESVILHGGAVRTPFVQKQLEAIVGDASKLRTNVNADEASVFGAAFKAASLSPSFRVKEIKAGDSAGYTIGWSLDNKDRSQTLFTPLSQIGVEKQVPFKNVEDFSFTLYQQVPSQDSGEHGKQSVLKVQTQNLTASVSHLLERFGCAATDVSTKFAIRLSARNGLPEVLEGTVSCETESVEKKGVVDGVKGLFGFGSKKGDQEQLQEESETDPAVPTSNVESSTTSSPAEGQTPRPDGKSDEKAKEPTKRTVTVYLSFTTEAQGIPAVSKPELKRIKDRLAAFDSSDRSRLLREEALNTLEAYTYRARDLLSDQSFIDSSTVKWRKEIEEQFRSTSEWLYGAGADANRDELKARLKELRSLVDPVQKRKEEGIKRPEQIRLLKEALDQTKILIAAVKEQTAKAASASSSAVTSSSPEAQTTAAPSSSSVDDFAELEDEPSTTTTTTQPSKIPEMPVYTVEDLEALTSTHESIQSWLNTKLAEQEKLAPHEEPAILSTDMEAKAKELNKLVMELLQKKMRIPKPKGNSKPKTAKKIKKSKTTSGSKQAPTGSEDVPNGKAGKGQMPTEEDILDMIDRRKGKDGKMPTEEDILEMIDKNKAKDKGEVHDEL
ncbi:lumenal Hsp70 protein [Acarospora aff. strigata]|nr:lumenal Hsp70 protein [Acarospora aff. strigata]